MPKTGVIQTPDGWMTRRQASKFYGININTLHRRIYQKWPMERIFTKPNKHGAKPKIKAVVDGKEVFIVEVYGHQSIEYRRALCRRDRGWSEDRLIEPPRKPKTKPIVTPWGIMTVYEAAKYVGVSGSVNLKRRLELGWSIEEALNTPPHGVRGRHFVMCPKEFKRRMKCYGGILQRQRSLRRAMAA